MMNSVADQVLKQFADNFASRVGAIQAASAAAAVPEPAAAPAAGGAPPAAAELNGLALLWAIVRDWLSGLVGKKAA